MSVNLPAILGTALPAVRPDGELIVVGQFALRAALPGVEVGTDRAPAELRGPAERAGGPRALTNAVSPSSAGWHHRSLMPLPTDAYLEMRAATARHRERAYAMMS